MRLYNLKGKLVGKNVTKYRIDWDKPCRSKLQFKVKQFLRKYWKNQIMYEEFPVFGSRLKLDFYNATRKIAIEVQGKQHSSYNKFFHKNSRVNYLNSMMRDLKKEKWADKNDILLIEIEEDEVDDLTKRFFKKNFNVIL